VYQTGELLEQLAVSVIVFPEQMVSKLAGNVELTTGCVGEVLTVTEVVADAVQPELLVWVIVYVPPATIVTLLILGFRKVEVKLLGPAQ
jgi:hypothetical protein